MPKFLACFFTSLLALGILRLDASAQAKSLYDKELLKSKSDNSGKHEPSNYGLTYAIELTRDGKTAFVDSRFPFRSGDQLRFHVESNQDAYLYILMKRGSSGASALLFPQPDSNQNNFVRAGQDLIVPQDGVLEFDRNPGKESLSIVLSKKRLEHNPDAYSRCILISPKNSSAAKKAACCIEYALKDCSKVKFLSSEKKGKFEREAAITVVSSDLKNPLAVEMELIHSGQVAAKPASTNKITESRAPGISAGAGRAPQVVSHALHSSGFVKDKWALIVGISEFKNPQWNLLYPAKDASDLGEFLVKEGHFQRDHVKVLLNAEASRENVLTALGSDWLPRNVRPGDLVLVYFASHGTSAEQDLARKNFLVAYDTDPRNAFATGIEIQDLARTIKRRLNTDRIVIVLDTCHSGSAQPGAKSIFSPQAFSFEDLRQGSGQLVIASAQENQIAHDSLRYKNGIFTKHFIDGLRQNKKLSDAFSYTRDKVEAESSKDFSQCQTPVLKDAEWKGAGVVLLVPPTEPRSAN
ncbi:MAG: caspase family protein [Candidatus Obscuribacterales bacterium]|nr:caspase family protein [Candidatus Obscuribacterales bacterium]